MFEQVIILDLQPFAQISLKNCTREQHMFYVGQGGVKVLLDNKIGWFVVAGQPIFL